MSKKYDWCWFLGYGSFDYEEAGYEESYLVKVDMHLNDEIVPELSTICHGSKVWPFTSLFWFQNYSESYP